MPYFYYIADQIPIVAAAHLVEDRQPGHLHRRQPGRHRRRSRSSTCTPQNITYVANPHYWQPGLPKIAKVIYPAFTSNDPANTYLATGQAQWGSQFIPNIKAFYTVQEPGQPLLVPADRQRVACSSTRPCPPLNNVRGPAGDGLRDRPEPGRRRSASTATSRPPTRAASSTPTFSQLARHAARPAKYNYGYNPAKAKPILSAAGYTRGRRRRSSTKAGKKLAFTIINIGGYSDWVAVDAGHPAGAEGRRHPGHAGQPRPRTTSSTSCSTATSSSAYDAETGGPTPYYELRQWLYSANSAPIGKQAAIELGALQQPGHRQADQLLRAHHETRRPSSPIMDQLEQVMLKRRAGHPGHRGGRPGTSTTRPSFTGWPTSSNPYAQPGRLRLPRHGSGAAAPGAQVEPDHEVCSPPDRVLRPHPVGGADAQLLPAAADAGQPGRGDDGQVPRPADRAGAARPGGRSSASTPIRACSRSTCTTSATWSPATSASRCSSSRSRSARSCCEAIPWTLGLVGVTTILAFVLGTVHRDRRRLAARRPARQRRCRRCS